MSTEKLQIFKNEFGGVVFYNNLIDYWAQSLKNGTGVIIVHIEQENAIDKYIIEVTDNTKEKACYVNYSTVCAKQRVQDILNKGIAAQAIRRHC